MKMLYFDWIIKCVLFLNSTLDNRELCLATGTMPVSNDFPRALYLWRPKKRLKHGRQNITLHWINGIIRNNKCIFTKLNADFILKMAAWTKKILQRLIPSQIPNRFNKPVSYVVNFINFINITLIYHITKQRVCETVSIIYMLTTCK
jgi:hypothetical protein